MKKPWRYHGECCALGGPAAKTLGACGPSSFGLGTSLGTTFTMIPPRLFQIMSNCFKNPGGYFTELHCTSPHCTSLHFTALLCTALHWCAPHCCALHCCALHCSSQGKCAKLWEHQSSPGVEGRKGTQLLRGDFYFYLAAENSLCRYWAVLYCTGTVWWPRRNILFTLGSAPVWEHK